MYHLPEFESKKIQPATLTNSAPMRGPAGAPSQSRLRRLELSDRYSFIAYPEEKNKVQQRSEKFIDSGVLIDHEDFEGRAVHFEAPITSSMIKSSNLSLVVSQHGFHYALDKNGKQETYLDERPHGTNSASIIGGTRYEVCNDRERQDLWLVGNRLSGQLECGGRNHRGGS
jgi:subtilisin family serine protease